jgi:uroporphyrinogen decarboxylase
MNSKERVQTALNHQEPDRVPMMMSAGTVVVERLKESLGVSTDRELLEALHIDIFDMRGIDYSGAIGAKYIGPDNLGISSDWQGEFFVLFGYYESEMETPFGRTHSMGPPSLGVDAYPTIADLERFPWPQPDWFDYTTLRPQLEEWSDFAIATTGCSVFQHPQLFRGVEQLMLEMAFDPELTEFILDKVTDFYFGYFQGVFAEVGDLIDIFRLADDIGDQQKLLISPKMLERYLAPRLSKCAALAHEHDIKVLFHTDGNVRSVIPELMGWGVDILDPVQPEAPNMNAIELKQEFGSRLSFSGGVSAQDVLSLRDMDEVRTEVKRAIDAFAPGGGYILSPAHPSLQVDIPTENIIALYKAGLEFGEY